MNAIEMEYSTLLVLASCLLWVFFQALQLARKKSSPAKLPPGPVPLPIIGSLFKLGNKPNEALAELAKTYGPLMTLRLGRVTTIVASSSTMAKEILQKQDHLLAGRTVVHTVCTLGYNDSSIAFSQPNQHWRKMRSICNTQIFTTQKLDSYQYLRRRKVQELLDHIREKSQTGQPVEIGEAVFTTTLNLLSNTAFSVDLVGFSSKSAQEFSSLVWGFMEEIGATNLADYFTFLSPFDPQGRRFRMTGHLKRLFSVFDEKIEERLQERRSGSDDSGKRNDFLDTLLDQGLSRHHIKSLLAARAELNESMDKGKSIEESDISRLPYLQAVVKETFRLHPPAPLLLPHKAESDLEIGGYTVPKDSKVLVNVWAIGRDPNAWVDANSFIPERFLGSNLDYKGRDFDLIPFGSGRRICPGLPLGSRMVHLTVASLLRSFDWKLPNGMSPQDMDMSHKFGITLKKEMDYYTLLVWVSYLWVFFQTLVIAKLPPVPVPLPVIGSLFKLGNKPNESPTRLAKNYGPLMTHRVGCSTKLSSSGLTRHHVKCLPVIGGFTIPKDAKVLVNVWPIGRDPDTWVDPTSFMPERFLGSNMDYKGGDFELIPFGVGRRICPGLPIASRMVHLMLGSLLRSFAWKIPNGMTPTGYGHVS
ncbi:Cytochrome P450 [Cinnamomum micranthum f. kanehirae]|uniref:Cytochrome P450 n=1 Tax=Cinnamomum micranthum f. kanehirae TaxID=337451 RepID=A0A443NQC7_9MAGN|nr:Cytochrome P450 [Cinnamomum micranthum f. kanehirae]